MTETSFPLTIHVGLINDKIYVSFSIADGVDPASIPPMALAVAKNLKRIIWRKGGDKLWRLNAKAP